MACAAMYGDSFWSGRSHVAFVQRYLRSDLVQKVLRLPAVVTNSIAPTRVNVMPNTAPEPEARYDFQFTIEGTASPWPVMFGMALLASGTFGCLQAQGSYRFLAIAALTILVFNLAMHSAFGNEFFLYSQHWLAALLVLLGGNLAYRGPYRCVGGWLWSLSLLAVLANNVARIAEMLVRLAR